MNEDRGYRDPLDADENIHTDLPAADAGTKVAAERSALVRDLTISGKALLEAADALLHSSLPDPVEAAVLVVRITEHMEERQAVAITRLVVDLKMTTRQVGEKLGWSQARVAFMAKAPRQR